MSGIDVISGGLVDSQILLCKRSVDTCRRQNIAGKKIPKGILKQMTKLSVLVCKWETNENESEPLIQ